MKRRGVDSPARRDGADPERMEEIMTALPATTDAKSPSDHIPTATRSAAFAHWPAGLREEMERKRRQWVRRLGAGVRDGAGARLAPADPGRRPLPLSPPRQSLFLELPQRRYGAGSSRAARSATPSTMRARRSISTMATASTCCIPVENIGDGELVFTTVSFSTAPTRRSRFPTTCASRRRKRRRLDPDRPTFHRPKIDRPTLIGR